jgi:hypothetical protein
MASNQQGVDPALVIKALGHARGAPFGIMITAPAGQPQTPQPAAASMANHRGPGWHFDPADIED